MKKILLNKPQLPLARYRFRFRAREAIRLPDYAGSAWRRVSRFELET